MTFLPVPLRAKTTTYNFCSPCPYSHPRIQDLHLHSCHLVTLSSAGTPFPPPPSHSFPCHPNRTHTQKGSPRHTMFLCTPFARHCRPRPPCCSLSLGSPLQRNQGSALAARLFQQPPGAAGPVGSPGPADQTEGDPGLRAKATPRWQTRALARGAVPPTRKNSPNLEAAATTT